MVGGRRVKHAASNETTTTSMVTGGVTNRSDNNVVVSTVQPTTTQQKVRRIFEEQARWQESGPRSRVKCTSSDAAYCVVNNCSIAVTKGEPARNNRAASETTTTTTNVTGKRRAPSIVNGRIHSKEEAARSGILAAEESRKPKDVSKARPGISRGVQRGIIKSASVPKDLKEGLPVRERTLQRVPEEGILKRSSAFLASLTHHHPSSKLAERNSPDDELVKFLRPTSKLVNGYEPRGSSSSRYTGLKGYFLTNGDEGLCALRPSPSVQTLSTSLKKKGIGVKKSVSFSSDTSFEEKRVPYRKPAVHEAKVYRKGVLQDHIRKETIKSKVPPSWETPSGGPTALLRAAREADDTGLKEIVAQARKVGLKGMDVNVVDSSGRTAISYMAGNGASSMLELALSFEGVDPNLPDNEGNTPLHFAAQAGQTECLNILLERCPDIEVDARNTLGFTPLMKAALQGRTKCAKILLFAGANPTLRDHGRGLRAEQWARFCGRYACAEMIERFARHRLLERTTSCRWGSEPELAAKVLQGKVRDAYTSDASAAILGIEVENKKSLPHHLQPRSNLLAGVATHQRGPLREQSGSAEAVTRCEKPSAAVERTPVKGDVGLTARLPGEDFREMRDKFHRQDRELHPEAATLEEEEQVVERMVLAVTITGRVLSPASHLNTRGGAGLLECCLQTQSSRDGQSVSRYITLSFTCYPIPLLPAADRPARCRGPSSRS